MSTGVREPFNSNPMKRVKPMIPNLGPNLGKLGFTDLKNDSNDERKVEEPVANLAPAF